MCAGCNFGVAVSILHVRMLRRALVPARSRSSGRRAEWPRLDRRWSRCEAMRSPSPCLRHQLADHRDIRSGRRSSAWRQRNVSARDSSPRTNRESPRCPSLRQQPNPPKCCEAASPRKSVLTRRIWRNVELQTCNIKLFTQNMDENSRFYKQIDTAT